MGSAMKKEKLPIIILLATTLGLTILLVVQHNKGITREKSHKAESGKEIGGLKGQVSDLVDKLNAAESDSAAKEDLIGSLTVKLNTLTSEKSDLDKNLSEVGKEAEGLNEQLGTVAGEYAQLKAKAAADLGKAQGDLDAKQQELLQTKENMATVEQNLADRTKALKDKESELLQKTGDLEKTKTELVAHTKALEVARKELDQDNAKIAKLESDLEKVLQQVGGLKANLGTLEVSIKATQKKLASAEGDRVFLMRELKRMQTEKDELVAQLNDLEAIRVRYKELKSEFATKLRESWKNNSIYNNRNKKGSGNHLAFLDKRKNESQDTNTSTDPSKLSISLDENGKVTITPISEDNGEKPKVIEGKPVKESSEPKEGGVVTPVPENTEEPKSQGQQQDKTKTKSSVEKPETKSDAPESKSASPPSSKDKGKAATSPVTPKVESPASEAKPGSLDKAAEQKPTSPSSSPKPAAPKSNP